MPPMWFNLLAPKTKSDLGKGNPRIGQVANLERHHKMLILRGLNEAAHAFAEGWPSAGVQCAVGTRFVRPILIAVEVFAADNVRSLKVAKRS